MEENKDRNIKIGSLLLISSMAYFIFTLNIFSTIKYDSATRDYVLNNNIYDVLSRNLISFPQSYLMILISLYGLIRTTRYKSKPTLSSWLIIFALGNLWTSTFIYIVNSN